MPSQPETSMTKWTKLDAGSYRATINGREYRIGRNYNEAFDCWELMVEGEFHPITDSTTLRDLKAKAETHAALTE